MTDTARPPIVDYLASIFAAVNDLDEIDPLTLAIAQEFYEAVDAFQVAQNSYPGAVLGNFKPGQRATIDTEIDHCAFNLVRDICRFVDELKGHNA